MVVLNNYQDFLAYRESLPKHKQVGFVPTMGALHNGHLKLVKNSKQRCDITVVSVYVNPRQFNQTEDFKKYPRHPEKDCQLLEFAGVDAVFMPQSEADLYPKGLVTPKTIDLQGMDLVMEGTHRPGHFKAVVEVVYRLFSVVRPHVAFFGKKDFQQYSILKYFFAKHIPELDIVGVETEREKDGLAMSSRNERLTPKERRIAGQIHAELHRIKTEYFNSTRPLADIVNEAKIALQEHPEFGKIDYLIIARESDLQEVDKRCNEKLRVFIAIALGPVRLIDNLSLNH